MNRELYRYNFNVRIAGVLYNILVKARLQQGRGETEAEYEARRAALIAKSKTGKTSAKRKLPESDDTFQERLAATYAEPGMFHREMLYISRDRFETLQAELWELTQAFLGARRRGVFYQNTAFCFHYRRPCAYFPPCRSGGSPNVIDNIYRKVPRMKSCGTGHQSKRPRHSEDQRKGDEHVTHEESPTQTRPSRSHGAGLRPQQDRQINLVFKVRRRAVPGDRT